MQAFAALFSPPSPHALSRLLPAPLGARVAAALRASACASPELRRAAALVAERIEVAISGAAAASGPGADAVGDVDGGTTSPAGGSRGEPAARPGAAPSAAGAAAAGAGGAIVSFDKCGNCGRQDARLLPCSACRMARCARPLTLAPRGKGARATGLQQRCLCSGRPPHPRSAAVATDRRSAVPSSFPPRYCSKDCQRANWPRHKLVCVPITRFQSRRAAAGGGA
jgi:hypothetical protein